MDFKSGDKVYFHDYSIIRCGYVLDEPDSHPAYTVQWIHEKHPDAHFNQAFNIENLYRTFKEAHLALKADILEQINDLIMGDLKRLYSRLETCEQQAYTGCEGDQ